MNKRAERETLAAAITAHLPAFEQRVRKQELAAVVAEALRPQNLAVGKMPVFVGVAFICALVSS